MKKTVLVFFSFLTSISIFSQKSEQNKLYQLVDAYYEEYLKFNPIQATIQGDFRYNNKLPNSISKNYLKNYQKFYTKTQQMLKTIDYLQLDTSSKIIYDVLKNEIESNLEGFSFHFERIPFTQFDGLPLQIPVMGSGEGNQPFKTIKDYENWIERINDFSKWADTAIENFKTGQKTGMVLPKILVKKMISQLLNEDIVTTNFEKNIFYGPVVNFPSDFTSVQKAKLARQYQQMILQIIIPTYTKLGKFLTEEYLPTARETYGYNSLPNGTAMYNYWIKYWTTTNKTSEDFYQAGLKQVDSLRNEIDKIRQQLNYNGSLSDFLLYVKTDPKAMPYKSPEEIVNAFRNILYKIEPKLNTLFHKTPHTPFEIRQTEKFRENTASAEYFPGTPDGTRPGIFYIPIPDATHFNIASGMESLFLHEAIPGHHYQVSLQQENTSLPKFMRFGWIGSYGEGWALYCESLGSELGLYNDPYQKLGFLSDAMLRSVRLVIDTGLHTRNMNREEAIEYFLANVSYNRHNATAEIERYIAYPGQALSYKAGFMKIQELKEKYQKKLGEKFNIAEFHDELLNLGCLPLNVLEKKMDLWSEKM